MSRLKTLSIVAGLLGLLTLTGLIAYSGLHAVLEAIADVGWGIVPVVLVRALMTLGGAVALLPLLPPSEGISLRASFVIRWVRDAINNLLPVAQVGGEVAGARLLASYGVQPTFSAAAILTDLLIQVVTQLLFTIVGLLVLVSVTGVTVLVQLVGTGLVIGFLGVLGFLVVQRGAGRQLLRRSLEMLLGGRSQRVPVTLDQVYDSLTVIHRNTRGILLCGLIHTVVWFLGALEVWIALSFMGFKPTSVNTVVLESLGQAVRSAAFPVPGALGAQEAGFVALCASFAIPAASALALSLVKRVADLMVGLPGLLVWQALEARQVFGASRS